MIDRRTVDLYAKFVDELNMVKGEFAKQAPILPYSQPSYAGRATWARALKRRIDNSMKVCTCICMTVHVFIVITA